MIGKYEMEYRRSGYASASQKRRKAKIETDISDNGHAAMWLKLGTKTLFTAFWFEGDSVSKQKAYMKCLRYAEQSRIEVEEFDIVRTD